MKLNTDIEARDKILFGKYRPNKYKFSGTQTFEGLDHKTLKELLDLNYLHEDDSFGCSPTVAEIYEFMKQYPKYKAHGYAESDSNYKHGICITGVEKGEESESVEEFKYFSSLFMNCYVFSPQVMYCLFDQE